MALPPRVEPESAQRVPALNTMRSAGRARARFDPRLVLALTLLAAAFGLSGYLLWGDTQAHASHSTETRVLGRALGRELQTQGDVSALASKLTRAYLRQPISLRLGKQLHVASRSALGVSVDQRALIELLRAASDARSPLRRLHAQQRGDVPLDLPMPAQLEGDRAERWLGQLAAAYDQPPLPTRVAFKDGSVIAARPGRKLDLPATLDALAQAIFLGDNALSASVLEVSAQASRLAAPGLVDVSRVLGSFESRIGAVDPLRMRVLSLLVARFDSALIGAGEELDFLALGGPLHGADYPSAGVDVHEGDRVEAAASQVASALDAAALFAGLPIVEQHARTRPSSDIELGFDTSVASPHNLRFRNDLLFPIAIAARLQDGVVRVSLRGAASHAREVDVERSIDEVLPYVELTRADPSMPSGALQVVQRGHPGLRVSLTRSVRESEDDTSQREQRSAIYPSSPRIVRVGNGSGTRQAFSPNPTEPGAEYLVDELVSYGMRPGLELPQQSERRAGRTGVEGWSLQDGP